MKRELFKKLCWIKCVKKLETEENLKDLAIFGI